MTVFSRPATEHDEILGVRPRVVHEPATEGEAAEAVGESAAAAERLAFVGGGTDLGLGAPPQRLDAVISTGRLCRVVEHAPADQILVAQAGLTIAALQRTVAVHGQRLSLDPPLPERATVGGVVAANAYGPRRARFGSIRDLIIGVAFVRADGKLAKGGGKVVKNVAGFDLPKLMVGSLGTLGLVTTATFRLHPSPEEESTVLVSAIPAILVRELAAAVVLAQLEPVSLVAVWREDGLFDLAVRFEGFRAGVVEQRERFCSLARERGKSSELLDDSAGRVSWQRHDRVRTAGTLRGKLAASPAHVEVIAREILPPLLSAFASPGFVWYASLGLGFFCGTEDDPSRAAAAIESARQALARLGATLILSAASAQVRQAVDVWGPAPPALSLMKNLKQRLDPDRRLAPGRFVGGI